MMSFSVKEVWSLSHSKGGVASVGRLSDEVVAYVSRLSEGGVAFDVIVKEVADSVKVVWTVNLYTYAFTH